MAIATIPKGVNSSPSTIARGDLSVVRRLFPYLWEFRGRVFLALAFLVAAKLANITVPIVMKRIVDGLTGDKAVLAVPVSLLLAYALLRLSSTLFNELRDVVFVKVAQLVEERARKPEERVGEQQRHGNGEHRPVPVSYTHLTLPTIYSV